VVALIKGTKNWHTALLDVLDSMLSSFIHTMTQTLVHHVAVEATKTAATKAGAEARTAAEASAQDQGLWPCAAALKR